MDSVSISTFFIFFFFQAEDGIRYSSVTGVQTCALPISDKNNNKVEIKRMEKTINVPTGYVRYLLSQVEKQGYNLDELLAIVGIDPTEIEQRT